MADSSANYDQVAKFSASPDEVANHGKRILSLADEAAHSILRITDSFNSLHVAWAGKTKEEAEDFGKRWTTVMTELFGTEKNPEKGVLNAMGGGVMAVAALFSVTERAITHSFGAFRNALAAPDKNGNSDTPPQDVTDVTSTAVTERW